MDIDFSGLWSWTVPLWGLFLLVLFLVGVLNTPVIIEGIMPSITPAAAAVASAAGAAVATGAGAAAIPIHTGGARNNKRVRFAN